MKCTSRIGNTQAVGYQVCLRPMYGQAIWGEETKNCHVDNASGDAEIAAFAEAAQGLLVASEGMTMTTVIALSIVASIVGVFALIRGRRKLVAASGAVLVFAAIAALVWTRPSTARFEQQHDAIGHVCSQAATQFEIFELRHRGDDPLMPPPPSWSADLRTGSISSRWSRSSSRSASRIRSAGVSRTCCRIPMTKRRPKRTASSARFVRTQHVGHLRRDLDDQRVAMIRKTVGNVAGYGTGAEIATETVNRDGREDRRRRSRTHRTGA